MRKARLRKEQNKLAKAGYTKINESYNKRIERNRNKSLSFNIQ